MCGETHGRFVGVAVPALRMLFTRGWASGVTVTASAIPFVVATQRPTTLPEVAVSQADLLVGHQLTTAADVETL